MPPVRSLLSFTTSVDPARNTLRMRCAGDLTAADRSRMNRASIEGVVGVALLLAGAGLLAAAVATW